MQFKVIKSTRITVSSAVAYGTRNYNQEEALALLRAERDRIESTMELLRRDPTLCMRLKRDGNKVARAQVLRARAENQSDKARRKLEAERKKIARANLADSRIRKAVADMAKAQKSFERALKERTKIEHGPDPLSNAEIHKVNALPVIKPIPAKRRNESAADYHQRLLHDPTSAL